MLLRNDGWTMNQEYFQQAQRLQELRAAQISRQQATAYGYTAANDVQRNGQASGHQNGVNVVRGVEENEQPVQDPLIFPGVYAPSGFDIMDILVSVHTRPNPTIKIGSIDHSVALTLCDTTIPDMPIVYCSDPFGLLTGYTPSEIVGRNCRFLQQPPSNIIQNASRPQPLEVSQEDRKANEEAKKELKEKMANGEEARISFVNFTKAGKRFINIVTTVPVVLNGQGGRYIVGFQADAKRVFG